MDNPRDYYSHCGPLTALDTHAAGFDALPKDLASLCEVLHGVLIHRDMAEFAYGVTLSDERKNDAHLRPIRDVVARIRALDDRPLTVVRDPDRRVAAVCRHFSAMLCAILRSRGAAARARCGFAAYFTAGRYEDHWVCECWNDAQARWVLVDPQLDAVQRKAFHLDFDPLDVPRDRFIVAGAAWRMCREGHAEADHFGLSHVAGLRGTWFIAGNVVRDLAALNRMEMLPWDVLGLMPGEHDRLSAENQALLDRVAGLTLEPDGAFSDVRAIYDDNRLRVSLTVFNVLRNAHETIEA